MHTEEVLKKCLLAGDVQNYKNTRDYKVTAFLISPKFVGTSMITTIMTIIDIVLILLDGY